MITISNINSKWDEIKGRLNPETVKMASDNGFLESAENWEDLKEFFDNEAKDLLNRFIDRVNKELNDNKPKETKPKASKNTTFKVGDVVMYRGEEWTIESFNGLYEGEVVITKSISNGIRQTMNVSMNDIEKTKKAKAPKAKSRYVKKWFEILSTPPQSPESKFFHCTKFEGGLLKGKAYDENGKITVEETAVAETKIELLRELEAKPMFNKKSKAPKKEFEGEYVEILSPEISFIKRYCNLQGKRVLEVRERVRLLLASLQKAIVEKKIRKTSNYADTIMRIQSNLIKLLATPGTTEINIVNIDELKATCGEFAVMPNARIVKAYLSIQGKENVKERAKALMKRVETSKDTTGRFNSEMADIKRSLERYIDGETDTPELSQQTLAGLRGLAGVSDKKKVASGNALGSVEFLSADFKILPFSGKWKQLIGSPSEPFKIMIYGKAGNGKSSCALQLAQYLATLGKRVLYVSDEEKFSYTLQEKMKRFKIAHQNLFVIDKMPNDTTSYNVIFIDSVNSIGYEPEDLRKLDKGQSWVYVFQTTKEGNFRGSQEFEHDVDVSIEVEKFKAHSIKNRFGGKEEINV